VSACESREARQAVENLTHTVKEQWRTQWWNWRRIDENLARIWREIGEKLERPFDYSLPKLCPTFENSAQILEPLDPRMTPVQATI